VVVLLPLIVEAAVTEAAALTGPEAVPVDHDHLPEAVGLPPVPVPVQDPAAQAAAPGQVADGNN
jgi:hypothetical protein